jgi:hypothetical protein
LSVVNSKVIKAKGVQASTPSPLRLRWTIKCS